MRPTTIAPALALAALSVALLGATATAATAADITNAWSLTARNESGAEGATDDHDTSEMDMGGMDMGDAEMGSAEPAEPAHDPEGPHDSSTGAGHEDSDGGAHGEETTTHDSAADTSSPRPLTAVLSIFFIVNAGVLGAAAGLRRRDRNNPRHRPGPAAAAPPATQPA